MLSGYLNQLLRDGQFWFLKESALELWLLDRNPKVLPYLAIAYCGLEQAQVGQHWLQQSCRNLSTQEQKALAVILSDQTSDLAIPRLQQFLNQLAV